MSGTRIAVLLTVVVLVVAIGLFASVLLSQLSAEQYLRQDTSQVSETLVKIVGQKIAEDRKLSSVSLDGPCFVINREHAPGAGMCEVFRRSRPSGQCRPVVVIGELSKGLWPRVQELSVALVSEIVMDQAEIAAALQEMRPGASVSSTICDGFLAFQMNYEKEGQ